MNGPRGGIAAVIAGLLAIWAQLWGAPASAARPDAAVLADWMFAYEFARRCPGLDTLDLAVLDERLAVAQRTPAPGEDSAMHSPWTPGATGYAFAQAETRETAAARAASCGDPGASARITAARSALAPYRQGWLRAAAGILAEPPRRLPSEALAGIDRAALEALIAPAPEDAVARAFAEETLRAIRRNDRRGRNLGEIYVGGDSRTAEVTDQAGMALRAARIALEDAGAGALLVAALAPTRPSIAPTERAFWDAFAAGPLRARSPVSDYTPDATGPPCAMFAARIALARNGRVLVHAPHAYAPSPRFTLLLRDPGLGPAPVIDAPGQIEDWRWPSLQKALSAAPPAGAAQSFALVPGSEADAAAMQDPSWRPAQDSLGPVLAAEPAAGALLARLGAADAAVVRIEGDGCAAVSVHVPLGGLGYALGWGEAAG